jgi:hypothetical protein
MHFNAYIKLSLVTLLAGERCYRFSRAQLAKENGVVCLI